MALAVALGRAVDLSPTVTCYMGAFTVPIPRTQRISHSRSVILGRAPFV